MKQANECDVYPQTNKTISVLIDLATAIKIYFLTYSTIIGYMSLNEENALHKQSQC